MIELKSGVWVRGDAIVSIQGARRRTERYDYNEIRVLLCTGEIVWVEYPRGTNSPEKRLSAVRELAEAVSSACPPVPLSEWSEE